MTAKTAIAEPAPVSTATGFALICLAVALVLIVPVWLVDIVPTQDGPIHLTQADMIARFGWGGALVVLSVPARLALAKTASWLAFAGWLAG